MNRIFGFDIARAVAIGLVVLSHIHQGSHDIGIYGVELFFALSGFLIGTILYRCVPAEGKWTFEGVKNFWRRRWWRTLPNYYLFLLILIVFHYGRGEWPESGWTGLLPFFIFAQDMTTPNIAFFGVSWSLCVEECFYVLFPLLVLLFHRVTGSRNGAFALSIGVFILFSMGMREVFFAAFSPVETRVITLPRLDAIGYGVALAVWTQAIVMSPAHRWRLAFAGTLMLSGVLIFHVLGAQGDGDSWFYRIALIGAPLSFSLIMPLLGNWKKLPSRFGFLTAPVTAISQWSYSIYLCHLPILMAIYPLFGSLRDNHWVNLASKVLGLGVILLVSHLVFRHFESRFTAMRPAEIHVGEPPSEGVLPDRIKPTPSNARV